MRNFLFISRSWASSLLMLAGMLFAFSAPAMVSAEEPSLTEPAGQSAGIFRGVSEACFEQGLCTACDVLIVLIEISNIILRLLAVLALVFFLWGAGYLLLSSGNDQMVSKGKAIIRATIVGTIIVLVSWQLMAFIVTIIANGNIFNERNQIEGNNPVANWFAVADQCRSAASRATGGAASVGNEPTTLEEFMEMERNRRMFRGIEQGASGN